VLDLVREHVDVQFLVAVDRGRVSRGGRRWRAGAERADKQPAAGTVPVREPVGAGGEAEMPGAADDAVGQVAERVAEALRVDRALRAPAGQPE
jgi:hypothetical protein